MINRLLEPLWTVWEVPLNWSIFASNLEISRSFLVLANVKKTNLMKENGLILYKGKVYLKRGRKELNLDWFETYQEAVDMKKEKRLAPTMFPNEQANHPLNYTARVLPHQNDTGGFYIALLRKKEEKV